MNIERTRLDVKRHARVREAKAAGTNVVLSGQFDRLIASPALRLETDAEVDT